MQELISVIIKEPNKDPERKVIKNTLEAMQSIVEGNIEIVPLASEVLIVCNEESLIHHLPYNYTLDHHSIYGTFFLCGFEGENLCSLPEEYEMGKGGGTLMNYDNIPAVRRSELWEIRKSPLHYLYAVNNPPESTPALEFGTAAHKYILEQDDFWNDFAIAPVVDRRTKEGKARWLQFQDMLEETGKKSISVDDLEAIKQMDEAILRNPTATALLKTGIHETPITWVDGETGELCKCRPDCLTVFNGSKYIVDYKTTTSCEDGHFERSCRQYGYKLQAAMYTEGMFNQEFENYGFAFVAQEKKPPYAVRVYFCDRGFIEEGIEVFRSLIGRYHKCRVSGEWPGYEDKELLGDE